MNTLPRAPPRMPAFAAFFRAVPVRGAISHARNAEAVARPSAYGGPIGHCGPFRKEQRRRAPRRCAFKIQGVAAGRHVTRLLETLYPMEGQVQPAHRKGNSMRIGQLADATATQVETIRFYEREALLPQTARTDGNYRVYDGTHVERLAFIRHCRSLDMSLDDIRLLLRFQDGSQEGCGAVNELLDEQIRQTTQRIRELRTLGHHLRDLRRLCQETRSAQECGILLELVHEAETTRPRRRTQTAAQALRKPHPARRVSAVR